MKKIPVVNTDLFALIDDEDYELVNKFKWFACRCHTKRSGDNRISSLITTDYKNGKKTVYMHRLIMDAVKGATIDHANGDVLDNRKTNLRICTKQQNAFNARPHKARPYKGVSKSKNKYRARITKDGITLTIGFYNTPEEASEAYRLKSVELFGEFSSSLR